jgi:hypothetical protein
MTRRWLCATMAVAALGLVHQVQPAAADVKSPEIEVSVIHALHSDGGVSIDPVLRDLPQLTKDQPFVRYNVFRLLDRKRLALFRGKPAAYGVVDGRTLQVTLVDVTAANGGPRYHVRAEIAGPDKKEFLKLLEVTAGPNEPFFVGGQSYGGGTLFLEFAVR